MKATWPSGWHTDVTQAAQIPSPHLCEYIHTGYVSMYNAMDNMH